MYATIDNANSPDTFLSTYFHNSQRADVTDRDISAALKMAALVLDYPSQGFPIDRIDMHLLFSGGANALALAGYSDCQIQKMRRRKGITFKEYIREELHVFSQGMSQDMKKHFRFVNISGGVYQDITEEVVAMEYTVNAAAAKLTPFPAPPHPAALGNDRHHLVVCLTCKVGLTSNTGAGGCNQGQPAMGKSRQKKLKDKGHLMMTDPAGTRPGRIARWVTGGPAWGPPDTTSPMLLPHV